MSRFILKDDLEFVGTFVDITIRLKKSNDAWLFSVVDNELSDSIECEEEILNQYKHSKYDDWFLYFYETLLYPELIEERGNLDEPKFYFQSSDRKILIVEFSIPYPKSNIKFRFRTLNENLEPDKTLQRIDRVITNAKIQLRHELEPALENNIYEYELDVDDINHKHYSLIDINESLAKMRSFNYPPIIKETHKERGKVSTKIIVSTKYKEGEILFDGADAGFFYYITNLTTQSPHCQEIVEAYNSMDGNIILKYPNIGYDDIYIFGYNPSNPKIIFRFDRIGKFLSMEAINIIIRTHTPNNRNAYILDLALNLSQFNIPPVRHFGNVYLLNNRIYSYPPNINGKIELDLNPYR